jgi:DNA-directed RNA polymerase specialized sigma24 family protein
MVSMPGSEATNSMTLTERLDRIESLLATLLDKERVREWYSVEEFARICGRAPFTVREWARRARLLAVKKESGRGAHASWAISHAELLRYQREGLLPVNRPDA